MTKSIELMSYVFKVSLYIVLIRVSFVKQEVIKIIIIVEFIYLCVIGVLLGKIRRWIIILLMVFTALERVVRLTLLMVIGKFKSRLRQTKFFKW